MNLLETNRYLTWLSQADSRVKVTEPNAIIWQDALQNATAQEVFDATLEFTRTNEGALVTPAAIRRMAYAIRERAVAKQSALTAGPAEKVVDYQKFYVPRMERPEFQELMEQGRLARRRRLGIPE